jgi:hypothetical protein
LLDGLKKYIKDISLISDVVTIEELLQKEFEKGEYSAFYLVNLGAVVEKFLQWYFFFSINCFSFLSNKIFLIFPGRSSCQEWNHFMVRSDILHHHRNYSFNLIAVKSNPDINIVRTLQFLGSGFDCASSAEFEEVLSVGAKPDKIIYANPAKGKGTTSYYRYF